jgi:hypothetical protein
VPICQVNCRVKSFSLHNVERASCNNEPVCQSLQTDSLQPPNTHHIPLPRSHPLEALANAGHSSNTRIVPLHMYPAPTTSSPSTPALPCPTRQIITSRSRCARKKSTSTNNLPIHSRNQSTQVHSTSPPTTCTVYRMQALF